MSTFDDRERSYEKKFALDEELRFKATARRNKLLGRWAAEKIGLSDGESETYAKDVVIADLEEPGEEDVFRKIRDDFDARGVDCLADCVIRVDFASDLKVIPFKAHIVGAGLESQLHQGVLVRLIL